MPSQTNINQVEKLKEQITEAKSVVLSDYRGLKVDQVSELRSKIKEVDGELKVAKNTLISLALKNLNYPLPEEKLTGPTVILLSYKDEIAPLKALYTFSQENDLPKIKLGYLNQELLTEDRVIELAKLPTKEALQAKLVATLNGPIYGLAYVLKGNLNKLVNVLKQIKDNKNSKGGE